MPKVGGCRRARAGKNHVVADCLTRAAVAKEADVVSGVGDVDPGAKERGDYEVMMSHLISRRLHK